MKKQPSVSPRQGVLGNALTYAVLLLIAASPSLSAQTCDDWKAVTGWQGTYTLTSNGTVMHGSTNRFFISETSGATVNMPSQIDGLCNQLGWAGADPQNTGSVSDSTQILNGCQQGQWFTSDALSGNAGYPSNSELYIDATGGTFSFQPISHDWATHTVYSCQGQQSQDIEWATAPADNWPVTFTLPQQVGPLTVSNYHFTAASRYAGYQDIDWTISFNLTPILASQNALTVTVQGTGNVTSTDGFINCPGSCTHAYSSGTQVTLNASPAAADFFVTWGGPCSGTEQCIVTMSQPQTVSAFFSPPLQLKNVTPCRVIDTRNPTGQFGGPPLQGGSARSFPIPQGSCNIPPSATAYSLNVTVAPGTPLGYLTVWPTGQNQPTVSTMNSPDGRTKANAAIVPAGTNGAVSFYASNTTTLIVDIDGYFQPGGDSTYQFYSIAPCRVIDTRGANGDFGGPYLSGGQVRIFPVEGSPCLTAGDRSGQLVGVREQLSDPGNSSFAAYSLNVTVLPHIAHQVLRYLTVWPEGQTQPVVSTLNNPKGTTVANAAIVPSGTGGGIAVYASDDTDLIVDINGYFGVPGAHGLSLYPAIPCRVLDTRDNHGQPFSGEKTINVVGSPCAPPNTAEAYVFNATVVPPGAMGFLTLWPDGQTMPLVSTLNAPDGYITSNMAVVPTMNGSIDAYASALTQLLLDISAYFAP